MELAEELLIVIESITQHCNEAEITISCSTLGYTVVVKFT